MKTKQKTTSGERIMNELLAGAKKQNYIITKVEKEIIKFLGEKRELLTYTIKLDE